MILKRAVVFLWSLLAPEAAGSQIFLIKKTRLEAEWINIEQAFAITVKIMLICVVEEGKRVETRKRKGRWGCDRILQKYAYIGIQRRYDEN